MKALVLSVLFAAVIAGNTFGQHRERDYEAYQSVFMSSSDRSGWFFEINNSASSLNSKITRMPGFTAGFVMNPNMYVGLRAKSFTWDESYLEFDNVFSEDALLSGGYAGLYLESGVNSNNLFHVTFPVTLGAGGAAYLTKASYPEIDDIYEFDFSRKELSATPFLICEPGINLEMNVTGFLKVAAGYSYRWLYGVNLENTHEKAFNGGSLNIGLRVGKF